MTKHIDAPAVLESPEYAATRARLTEDPIVQAMAAELYAGVRAGHVTSAQLFHDDDGSPRFELMQRTNTEYARRGGTGQGHIGAIAEAIVLIWTQEGPR